MTTPLSNHKVLEAQFIFYSFMPQSLLQGLTYNGLSKMFIRQLTMTISINEVSHRIIVWVSILRKSDNQVLPEPTVKDPKATS